MESAAQALETTRIPRVAIYIPANTSYVKYEPEYCLRLYQQRWKGHIADPSDPIRIIPFPPNVTEADRFKDIVGNADEARSYEAARLRSEFGIHEKTGEPLFDMVYPDVTFDLYFDRILARTSQPDVKLDPVRTNADSTITFLESIPGVGASAKRLVDKGYDTIKTIALADEVGLAKYIGKGKAAAIIEAAKKHLGADKEVTDIPAE